MKAISQVLAFDVVSKAMLGIVSIAYIRFVPETEFAILTFAIAISTIIGQVFSASFNRIYILGYSHLGLEGRFQAFAVNQAAAIIFASVILLPFTGLKLDAAFAVILFALALALFEAGKTVFQQKTRFLSYSLLELSRALLVLLGALILIVSLGENILAWHVLLVQAAGMMLVFLGFIHIDRHSVRRQPETENGMLLPRIWRGPYRYLFGYFLVLSLFVQMDVMMLWYMGTEQGLASYGAAFRYYGLLSLVLGAVHVVLLPAIQQAVLREDLGKIFHSHKLIVLLFLPLIVLSALSSGIFMPWVDQGRYPDSVTVFQILCVSVALSLAFSPHVNWLMRAKRFKFLFLLICVAAMLNFAMNYLLIPTYGAVGVAVATTVSSAAVNVPIFFLSWRLFRSIPVGGAVDEVASEVST